MDRRCHRAGVSATTRYGLGARGVDFIERTTSGGVTRGFPIYDAHGNMVATLSRSGTNGYSVNDRRSYSAWGDVRTGNVTGAPKGRYCASLGHKADDESGCVYMRARYYQPTEGRFLSEDSAMDGTNYFVYCHNNPVGNVDRDGRMSNGEEFLLSVALFVTGYVLLLNGVVPDLEFKLIRIAGQLKDAYNMSKAYGMFDEMSKQAFQRAKRLEEQQAKTRMSHTILAAVGYSMTISALLLDIDLVGSGFDMLTTLYGNS